MVNLIYRITLDKRSDFTIKLGAIIQSHVYKGEHPKRESWRPGMETKKRSPIQRLRRN